MAPLLWKSLNFSNKLQGALNTRSVNKQQLVRLSGPRAAERSTNLNVLCETLQKRRETTF